VEAAAIEGGRVRVAVGVGGEPLGFAVVADCESGARDLEDLFVEPSATRRGVGRALIEDALHGAIAAGCGSMIVTARPRSVAFYERAGFTVRGPAETLFGLAVRMARGLPGDR
jgi:GNAT superfamily N-acetyltransferase